MVDVIYSMYTWLLQISKACDLVIPVLNKPLGIMPFIPPSSEALIKRGLMGRFGGFLYVDDLSVDRLAVGLS